MADRAELKEQNPELHKVLEGAGNPQLELRGFDPGFKILQGGGFGEINEAKAEAFDRPGNAPLPLPGDPIQAVIEKGAEEKLEKNEKGS